MSFPVLCQHQRRIWSFLSIVDDRFRAWAEFIWKTICCRCNISSTLHSTNEILRNNNTASDWSQCYRRIATRTTMFSKSNCLRGSSSGFFLRVYSQSLSHKRVYRKAAEVWYQGCLPLEGLTYTCLMRSFYPGFNNFSLSSSVQFRFSDQFNYSFGLILFNLNLITVQF